MVVFFGHRVIHPIDARSDEPLLDMHLEFPLWGAAVEPLAAAAHIVSNAGPIPPALYSAMAWATVLTGSFAWWRTQRLGVALVAAASVAGMWLLYVAFALLTLLPTWRLVVDDPRAVVVDLHAHTYRSRDGLISTERNLRAHQAQGFDVVAFTEHDHPEGAFAAQRYQATQRPDLPAVLPGVELRGGRGAFLLAVGLRPDVPLALSWRGTEAMRPWIRQVQDVHGGAVIAMSWRRRPEDIAWLVRMGVDGIEISNAGHPKLPEAVWEAVRAVNADVPVVASTDSHGWSNLWHTWTVVRARQTDASPTAAVLAALRERRVADVIPVTLRRHWAPSVPEMTLAPFLGLIRYARQLSPPRLASWWGWVLVVWGTSLVLRRYGWRPGLIWFGGIVALMGVGMLTEGWALMSAWWQGDTIGKFVRNHAFIPLGAGSVALGVAAVLWVGAYRQRSAL
jgi:hypothetical protein